MRWRELEWREKLGELKKDDKGNNCNGEQLAMKIQMVENKTCDSLSEFNGGINQN